jgi:hypothetical protein
VSFKASELGAALFTAPPLLACYDTVSDQAATAALGNSKQEGRKLERKTVNASCLYEIRY